MILLYQSALEHNTLSSNNVQIQRNIRLDYDKQKRTITCQFKPITSIRLQLQVSTCHTLGAVSENGARFWKGLFQADIQ